jgi:hypothetical protein
MERVHHTMSRRRCKRVMCALLCLLYVGSTAARKARLKERLDAPSSRYALTILRTLCPRARRRSCLWSKSSCHFVTGLLPHKPRLQNGKRGWRSFHGTREPFCACILPPPVPIQLETGQLSLLTRVCFCKCRFHNFLSEAEVDHLVGLAKPHMQTSEVRPPAWSPQCQGTGCWEAA